MRNLIIELRKNKRSGAIPVLILTGMIGALYAYANFAIRKETLLSLPLPPMVILLTQLYGMIMVLNLFGIIVSTTIIFGIEHQRNSIKKMYMLPIKISSIYMTKFIILFLLLFLCIAVQSLSLTVIGRLYLPEGTFEAGGVLVFAVYSFITSLPVLSFMLLVSSRAENLWITLGIGVVGFLSGMAMASTKHLVLLLNPFVLIMRPAMSASITPSIPITVLSIVSSIVLIIAGYISATKFHYE